MSARIAINIINNLNEDNEINYEDYEDYEDYEINFEEGITNKNNKKLNTDVRSRISKYTNR